MKMALSMTAILWNGLVAIERAGELQMQRMGYALSQASRNRIKVMVQKEKRGIKTPTADYRSLGGLCAIFEPELARVVDGLPNRMDRTRSIVPIVRLILFMVDNLL
jgi:hypothetical protein